MHGSREGGDLIMPSRYVIGLIVVALIMGTFAWGVGAQVCPPSEPRTLYVSAVGSDAAAGTSPSTPWRTLARVNAEVLNPGDVVSFRAGDSFPGSLLLTRSGSATEPITVTAYGTGAKPQILAGMVHGVHILNAEYIVLSGLKITGPGPDATLNTGDGVLIENALPVERTLSSITVDDLDVSGFHYAGLEVKASVFVNEATQVTRRRGYQGLRFTRLDLHHNGWGGMWIGGCGNYPAHPTIYCHRDVYIADSQFHDNDGVIVPYHTGDGLYVWDVDGAVIERNYSYRNGRFNQTLAGPVGIWAYWSTRLTIQYNWSYENRTSAGDGGGFDLDGGVTDSVVQFNGSFNNDGAGYLIYQFVDTFRVTRGNIIRHNTSTHDVARGEALGAILIAGDGPVRNIAVYGNTITPRPGVTPIATYGDVADLSIHDNVVMTP
jgi:hypothetical protein